MFPSARLRVGVDELRDTLIAEKKNGVLYDKNRHIGKIETI